MGRDRNPRNIDTGRDAGGFVALPWTVLDCPAYACLGHPARALLFEMARQCMNGKKRDGNNGRLLASRAYLATRGWKSADVIDRAKRELLAAGFLHETVKGHRPNKASWYAVTWRELDRHPGYDFGAAETFERGAYRKNAPLGPSGGTGKVCIGPSGGTGKPLSVPSGGPMKPLFGTPSVPSGGHHLEKPSIAPIPPPPTTTDNRAAPAH